MKSIAYFQLIKDQFKKENFFRNAKKKMSLNNLNLTTNIGHIHCYG